MSEPNLRVLKPSRKAPRDGDLFVLSPAERTFLFGRVVATDAKVGPIDAIMIYIYSLMRLDRSLPPAEELSPNLLLVPPMFTNRLPWTRGFFEVLGHVEPKAFDRLPVHCFRDSRGRLFDEHSGLVGEPHGPVGQWGLQSFRTIDDAVSDALGIPRAPE